MADPLLLIEGVHKRFGQTHALRGVELSLDRGEVLALIGENGAGKSTLMKTLSGVHQPDEGRMHFDGAPYRPAGPLDARMQGVIMIYQELTLAADLTVAENIVLGVEPSRFGLLDKTKRSELARTALDRLGCSDIGINTQVRELSVGQQQMVEIARAMVTTPRVLVLDEPTSSLTRDDTQHLFEVIARLREQGVSIIYISHFLEECRAVADRYLVLRDGASVAAGIMAEASEAELIRHMVGREVDDLYPRSVHEAGEVVLSVKDLAGSPLPRSVNLELRAGEVLGIFGLVGSGRTEFLRCLFGLDRHVRGSIAINGQAVSKPDPGTAWKRGEGLVSENRKEEGLLLVRDIADNLVMPSLDRFARFGILNNRGQHDAADEWIDRLKVRCQGSRQAIGELSGGNQQKIAIGRLLHHGCEIIILDEPTRGIDVGAKALIYQLIDEQAQAGKAVLVVSSYVPELLGICDRLATMCRGTLGEPRPVSEWDEHKVIASAIGQEVVSG